MIIDLLELAKKAEALYRDVECSFGILRIYHVPDSAMLSVTLSYPIPEQPMVRMKTAVGHQERLSKSGDLEYAQWQKELASYDSELTRIRSAIRLVSALKDIPYPDISKPPTQMANEIYNGNWPDSEVMRKKIWLDFTIMSFRFDSDKIYGAINDMTIETDVTPEMVDTVKKNSG